MIYFNYLVFCGRFQPYHAGHHHVVKQALRYSSNVIMVLGSHDKARDSRNPFTTSERIEIIKSCLQGNEFDRVHFAPQYDHPYNEEKWIAGVQASVNTIIHRKFSPDKIKIGIIGYNKDHSSYYLKKFPGWDLIEIEPFKINDKPIDATSLRESLFSNNSESLISSHIVKPSHAAAITEAAKSCFKQINNEMNHIAEYKKSWSAAPYPPTFVTADALVTQSGHILLVRRGAQPGEGLWALPGGFINQHEKIQEAAIRELKEETKIDVPLPVLVGSIVKEHTYDDPHRSARGRTITNCYHFKLTDQNTLPKVKGSDDAAKAKWFTISEVVQMRSQMFEDHFSIIEHMLGL